VSKVSNGSLVNCQSTSNTNYIVSKDIDKHFSNAKTGNQKENINNNNIKSAKICIKKETPRK